MEKHNSFDDERPYEYIVVIGISTGGPQLLSRVVPLIDADLPATYVIVQHMPQGFTKNLATRLDSISGLAVQEAVHDAYLKRGNVYIAPGGKHLKLVNGLRPRLQVSDEAPYKGHKPSINMMVSSLARLNSSKRLVVAILTGMGEDGLEGVKELKRCCSCKVLAQNEATSVVYGMPKAIIEAGCADYVVPEEQIAMTIKKIVEAHYGH